MMPTDGAVPAPPMTLDRLTPRLATRHAANGLTNSVVLVVAASTVAGFLGSIALATVGEASGLSLLAARPLAAVQTAAGLSLCAAMLAIPALRGLGRLWVRREVRLLGDAVEILRHTPIGICRETVPLCTYRGVAHHVRASLSGLTHEIVLVHPNRDHSVALLAVDHVTQSLIEECKSLFRLPEVPSSPTYGRGERAGVSSVSPRFFAARA